MPHSRTPRENDTPSPDELRQQAEDRLDGLTAASTSPLPEVVAAVVHELRVHQIELEMQNEELRRAQLELDAQREKYFELFDLAPVGYVTTDERGLVADANLTAAQMLGVERQLLVGQPFSAFVLAADRGVYYDCKKALENTAEPQTCELRLNRFGDEDDASGPRRHFWARLEWRLQRVLQGETSLGWVTFTDIDELKQAENALRDREHRLLEHSRRGEHLNASLNEAGARINASFDLDSVLDDVLEIACEALDCDVALLGHALLGDWHVEHSFASSEAVDGAAIEDRFLRAMSSTEARALPKPDNPEAKWLSGKLGLADAIVEPIPLLRGASGELVFGRINGGEHFDDLSSDFARRLAQSLAVSFANVGQFEAERHIAETLQSALLLMPPSIPGLEFAHLYRSATSATRVGGDFYDVFVMHGGKVGVLVGDVSGKGLEAAVLTSIIKDTIKAFSHDTASPAIVIARANVSLGEAARLPDFASVFYGVIDVEGGSLTYCNAGHPPTVVIAADGSMRELEGTSPVIGAFQDLEYEERTVPLGPTDVVLLYTDGVTEARNADGVFFKEEGLLSTLKSADTTDVCNLPSVVLDAVMTFSGGRITDDIALLAFRLLQPPQPAQ